MSILSYTSSNLAVHVFITAAVLSRSLDEYISNNKPIQAISSGP